jgi:hypothetical protein
MTDLMTAAFQAMEKSLNKMDDLLKASVKAQRPSYKQVVQKPTAARA